MTLRGQLSLFQHGRSLGRRNRKERAAHEFKVQCMVADIVRRWCLPGWRWSHLPFGEHRAKATAGRLKRMGVNGGWPDFIFAHESGRVCWLELKRNGGELSDAQIDVGAFLQRSGHNFLIARGFDEAVAVLIKWGVIPSTVHVQ